MEVDGLSLARGANDAFTIFFNIFNELYNKNFPIVTKIASKKSILKPWVTESLVRRIKIRDRLGRLASKGRINREVFTRFRNQITAQLRKAKAKHYESEFKKLKGISKVLGSLLITVLEIKLNAKKYLSVMMMA